MLVVNVLISAFMGPFLGYLMRTSREQNRFQLGPCSPVNRAGEETSWKRFCRPLAELLVFPLSNVKRTGRRTNQRGQNSSTGLILLPRNQGAWPHSPSLRQPHSPSLDSLSRAAPPKYRQTHNNDLTSLKV